MRSKTLARGRRTAFQSDESAKALLTRNGARFSFPRGRDGRPLAELGAAPAGRTAGPADAPVPAYADAELAAGGGPLVGLLRRRAARPAGAGGAHGAGGAGQPVAELAAGPRAGRARGPVAQLAGPDGGSVPQLGSGRGAPARDADARAGGHAQPLAQLAAGRLPGKHAARTPGLRAGRRGARPRVAEASGALAAAAARCGAGPGHGCVADAGRHVEERLAGGWPARPPPLHGPVPAGVRLRAVPACAAAVEGVAQRPPGPARPGRRVPAAILLPGAAGPEAAVHGGGGQEAARRAARGGDLGRRSLAGGAGPPAPLPAFCVLGAARARVPARVAVATRAGLVGASATDGDALLAAGDALLAAGDDLLAAWDADAHGDLGDARAGGPDALPASWAVDDRGDEIAPRDADRLPTRPCDVAARQPAPGGPDDARGGACPSRRLHRAAGPLSAPTGSITGS